MIKKCTRCGVYKPIIEYNRSKRILSGYEAMCKKCVLARKKNYREKNKEKIKEKDKQYRARNKKKLKEKNIIYYDKHHNRIRPYKERNSNGIKKSREEILESYRKYNLEHKDRIKELSKIYWDKHPEEKVINRQNRRARIKEVGGSVTVYEWEQIKNFYNNTCLCCKKKEPEIKLTMDHVFPIFYGGKHSKENIQPLCLTCNCKKRTRYIDFRETLLFK